MKTIYLVVSTFEFEDGNTNTKTLCAFENLKKAEKKLDEFRADEIPNTTYRIEQIGLMENNDEN